MDLNQFNWISGLNESGAVAFVLYIIFFIIAFITVAMMFILSSKNKSEKKSQKELKKNTNQPPPTRARVREPAAIRPAKTTDDDYSNPIEEAQVYLNYGLHKQAADRLKKYLKENPSDKTANEMLAAAEAGQENKGS